jgi:hypothetical protein
MASSAMSVDEVMGILRTTVPRLRELTDGVAEDRLTAITDYAWSVNDQLAHLRACHDVLGGNMLRIIREEHPAWKGMSPGARLKQTDYLTWTFEPAFAAFRAQRTELLEALEVLSPEGWERTATVSVPPGKVYEYSTLYYGGWMARHERGHLRHIARILAALTRHNAPPVRVGVRGGRSGPVRGTSGS